jgi:Zinc-ribbon containing domain
MGECFKIHVDMHTNLARRRRTRVGFGSARLGRRHSGGEAKANPVPAGSDVSAGTYRCTGCGNAIDVGSTNRLPPCPSCGNSRWEPLSGGDSVNDSYPDN